MPKFYFLDLQHAIPYNENKAIVELKQMSVLDYANAQNKESLALVPLNNKCFYKDDGNIIPAQEFK